MSTKRVFRSHQAQRGFILITLYMLLTVLILSCGALVSRALSDARASERNMAGLQAFYLAEAGLDQGLEWLRSQPAPPAGTQPLVLFGGWQAMGQDGLYLVTVEPNDNNPNSFIDRYTLYGWGAVGPQAAPLAVRRTVMTVRADTFSRYAYFTDAERTPGGSRIWFITGDRIEGPTHSNSQFNMYGFPVFEGPVSSTAGSVNLWGGGPPTSDPVFNGGLTLNAERVPFPGAVPTALIEAAGSGGASFTGETRVILQSDGTMRVTNAAARLVNATMPIPANGALYVNQGNLFLQGTLSGQLTVGASNDIIVTDSVRYHQDPRTNPDSQDLLGIVAGRDVEIFRSAPFNVQIDASVMALNTSFTVQNWLFGPPKGTLTVYGGIIQNRRGPVGTFSSLSGRKLSGYTKDYHYDTRLLDMIPPYFPVTGDYVPTVWSEDY